MTKKILIYKSHAENKAGELVPDLFLFFKKTLYEVRAICLQIGFNIFRWPSNHTKPSKYWSGDMLSFDFLEKGLGIVSPPYCVYDFSRKMFLLCLYV